VLFFDVSISVDGASIVLLLLLLLVVVVLALVLDMEVFVFVTGGVGDVLPIPPPIIGAFAADITFIPLLLVEFILLLVEFIPLLLNPINEFILELFTAFVIFIKLDCVEFALLNVTGADVSRRNGGGGIMFVSLDDATCSDCCRLILGSVMKDVTSSFVALLGFAFELLLLLLLLLLLSHRSRWWWFLCAI